MAILRNAAAGTFGIALGLWATVPSSWAATEIGKTAIATNKVTGALEKSVRNLKAGDGIFQNETIDTGAESKAQLMFSDETSLTIGPGSSVVLSKFVYDPGKSSGQVVVNAVKGGLRFITGSLDKESYKIDTPVATLGVRGTIVELQMQDKWLIVSVFEGGVDLCNKAGRCTFLKPGTYAITDGNELSEAQSLISHGGTVFVDTPNPLFQATLGPTPTPLVSVAPQEVVEPPPVIEKPHYHKKHRRYGHHHWWKHRHYHHKYAHHWQRRFGGDHWWKRFGHGYHKFAHKDYDGRYRRWGHKELRHYRFAQFLKRFKAPHRFGHRGPGGGFGKFGPGKPGGYGGYADKDAVKKFAFGPGGPGGRNGRNGRH